MPALSEVADSDLLAMAASEPEAFGELFKTAFAFRLCILRPADWQPRLTAGVMLEDTDDQCDLGDPRC